jgi:RNA polymerase sigma factor (sigma-70 family)
MSLLNGKNFEFNQGQRFGLEINDLNRNQLEHEDLVNAGNISVIERFEKYDPSRAGVSTFVMYKAKIGMQEYTIENIPWGYKHRKRNGKEIPNNFSFDELTSIDNGGALIFPNRELEMDFLSQPAEQDKVVALNEMEFIFSRYLGELEPQTERILRQRFGIGVEKHTLKEIGLELGISSEWVRQIEVKGLRKIKESLKLAGLVDSYI